MNPIFSPAAQANVVTNSSCINGSIWWNYPKGKMIAHFRYTDHARRFSVCLGRPDGPADFLLYDVTNGHRIMMPTLSEFGMIFFFVVNMCMFVGNSRQPYLEWSDSCSTYIGSTKSLQRNIYTVFV
jgi:hypothetical protein